MTSVDLISDFNIEVLGRYLSLDEDMPAMSVSVTPFGQLFQSLQIPSVNSIGIIWARPEAISPSYGASIDGSHVKLNDVLSDVAQFTQLVRRYAETKTLVFVATFVASRNERGLGMLDWNSNGHSYIRASMNIALADGLAGIKGVHVLDSSRWLDNQPTPPRSAKHWFAMKSPFIETVYKAATRDIKAALRGALGQSRKLVVVDLDDTLWGGVVGEVGWDKLRLGGHDYIGEAFVDFQKGLAALTRRGIQVAIVSKNDEATALEAIDNHPAMQLHRNDLAGWRINWSDKAANIVDLATELNLGLQSIVFIDDNPAERGRVKEALPEVLVPDWPKDPTLYGDALRQLDYFEQAAITDEDRKRTSMYAVERERKNSSTSFSSIDEWLMSLDIVIQATELNESNLKRSVQLLNKTNQLNLSTRRLTEQEMVRWAAHENRKVITLSIQDRFGDLGLTGLISWERSADALTIVDYLLSCRAMGRQVETFMLHLAVDAARAANVTHVIAHAARTERNRPCLEFWQNQSKFTETKPNIFTWDTSQVYPSPASIRTSS